MELLCLEMDTIIRARPDPNLLCDDRVLQSSARKVKEEFKECGVDQLLRVTVYIR